MNQIGFLGMVIAAALAAAEPSIAETRQRTEYVGRARVIDGDTIRIGGDTIRLWGVDAPERDQVCLINGSPIMCGEMVLTALRDKVAGNRVRCRYKDWNEGLAAEHQARAVGQCAIDGADLGDWLVSRGLAVPAYADHYSNVGRMACNGRVGLWAGSFAEPGAWRRQRSQSQSSLGAQSGRSCRAAMRDLMRHRERYSRHRPRGI